MNITKIFFDIDGVLADFDKGVRELCGITPLPQSTSYPPGYDEKLWAAVKNVGHFYDKLDIIEEGKQIFDYVYSRFPDKCEILTGIPRPSRGIVTAAEDKVNWIRRNINSDIPIHTVLRKDKPLFCEGAGSILIDDFDDNIKNWQECGGTGILFSDDIWQKISIILLAAE